MADVDSMAELGTPTPSPEGLDDAGMTGGGTPNGPRESVGCTQIVPAQISLAPLLESVEVPDPPELPVTWSGAPTRRMLRRLALESRAEAWDPVLVEKLLDLVGDGMTVSKACELLGIRRSVVNAWRTLVPDFDALMTDAVEALGSVYADKAVVAVSEGDVQGSAAWLKVAAAFDRKIGGKDGGSGGSQIALVVNVNR